MLQASGEGTGTGGSGGAPGNGGAGGPAGPFDHPVPQGAAKKMSEVLGEIVWLMSQSQVHKQFFISDLEWFVMAPVLLQQFRTYYAQDRPSCRRHASSMTGVVLWATVSDEVAERLSGGVTKLRPQDWKSGEQLWAVEVIAPGACPGPRLRSAAKRSGGGVAPEARKICRLASGKTEMIKDLKAKVFPDRDVRYVAMTPGEGKEVRVV